MINKTVFDDLTKQQQDALLAASAKAEAFYLEEAKKADQASMQKFKDAGVQIAEMSDADFDAWRELAKTSAYKQFVSETENGQKLLDMALSVE